MKLKKRGVFLLITIVLLILCSIAIIAILSLTPQPPLESINRCQLALSKAKNAEATEYARDLMTVAETDWRQAMLEWKIQNIKWIFSRDYSVLTRQIHKAIIEAETAYKRSIQVKDSLHHDLAIILADVEKKLNHYEEHYSSLPLNRQSRIDYQTAKMLFLEAREAYERGNYNRVGPKAEKSKSLINESIRNNHDIIQDYFSNVSRWKQWANETIEWSKTNKKPVIIVDKFAQKCYLYQDGKKVKSFEAEFGINWIGVKNHKGDKATPEGKYHITKKKNRRGTKYYKALLINYPNEADKARFAEGVRKGLISKRANIGGLIEIHGGGGKGLNWTDGCVALTNEDMDKIFEMAEIGTPVTIIGSMKSLAEIDSL